MRKIFKHSAGCFNNDKTVIMGILNVTPDSFYDGGKYVQPRECVEYAKKMLSDGADIIDIGAMSTRPGSTPVSYRTEIERLKPVLSDICKFATVSVDTVYPETALFALENGASVINDVSGRFNPVTAEYIKKYSAGWILTHTSGVNSGDKVEYPHGVENAVTDFFQDVCEKCSSFGIPDECLCLDPGFGFAKNTEENISLLNNKNILSYNNRFVLSALSRKRFTAEITGNGDRLTGTLIANIVSVMNGADMLRVHDVKDTVKSLSVLGEYFDG